MDQHSRWATKLALVDPTMNLWTAGIDANHNGNYHLMRGSDGISGGVCCVASSDGQDIDAETPVACQANPTCDAIGNGIGADYYLDTDGDGTADRYDCNPSLASNSEVCDGDAFSSSQESACSVTYPGAAYDPSVYPGAPELCDGKDNDCTGGGEQDLDRDGYFANQTLCSAAGLFDCDETRARVYPGANQFCDGLNNDCNNPSYDPTIVEADSDYDSYRVCAGDCNDTNCNIHPNAKEICNGVDDNCDLCIDEGVCACLPAGGCCQRDAECCSAVCDAVTHHCR